jgi:hypothetical protein
MDSGGKLIRAKGIAEFRGEFLNTYGQRFFPAHNIKAVLGKGLFTAHIKNTVPDGITFSRNYP